MKSFLCFFLLLLITCQFPVAQEEAKKKQKEQEIIFGRVLNVKDGDSFEMVDDEDKFHQIRLEHVDCPEKKQAFGRKAQLYTFNFVFGKYITVRVSSRDRYKRKIAIVEVDGEILNNNIIRDGYGWHFKKYSKSQLHNDLEIEARKAKRGLWIDGKPKAPWEFRKRKPVVN